MSPLLNRRLVLAMLLLGLAGTVAPTYAKDGESESDKGGGDKSDSKSDSKSDKSDSKSDSKSDKSDDKGDKSDDKNDKDSDSKSGKNKAKDDDEKDDEDAIRSAVKSGDAAPLGKILAAVRKKYDGRIIRIRLSGSGKNLSYRIRMIDVSNKLIEVRVNAKTATIMGTPSLY